MAVLLCLSAYFALFIREYLAMIIIAALFLSILMNSRWSMSVRAAGILLVLFVLMFAIHFAIGGAGGALFNVNYNAISKQALTLQLSQNVGTVFPMLSENPAFVLLLLPYSFIMNLCFPFFILAENVQGFFQSCENVFLVYLLYYFIKYRKTTIAFAKKTILIRFLFFYFMVGLFFMAMINTNLGWATREKAMYLPALFILVSLVYVSRKNDSTLVASGF
jgi:hypothetical protein